MTTTALARPDADLLKQVNRRFVTGVTLVTAMDGDTPRGLAVNAFASISLDPPTVMVCVQRTSSTHDCLFRARHLAINIASVEQMDVLGVFASKTPDKFADVAWTPGPHGSPVLAGSSAVMEVEIRERLQASTHTVFICRVVAAEVSEAAPVVYSAGGFFDAEGLTPLT
ncbi:flavin reductase family protein [Nocardioides zeae]|uniref:Flavin reductase family protein n=1 Tax=Nocardioides imazamoxiresistens TaxID=3231893 RepID=A0ABU3PZN0_9ACTN|nr:flavin reductase family protein [Nocardioides zeae]MDT9594210.1 flavin reductase family protein [Nocardioides zeae]